MNNMLGHNQQAGAEKKAGRREKVIPLLTLLLVIVITVIFFVYRTRIAEFKELGYLGAFLISLVTNATVILPMPGLLLLSALSTAFNPVLVALAGATGGIIGEITGYMAGYSGRGMVQDSRLYARMEGWMRRWGVWAIFVFAVTPFLLLDVAGITAGVLRFPLWKFLLVGWIGKSLKYIGLLWAGAWGWEVILRYIT